MAPFVSKQLIQHLVTSNPSPAYVQRVARYSRVRQGRYEIGDHGDSDRSGSARRRQCERDLANPTFGHLREPMLFLAEPGARIERRRVTATNSLNYTRNEMGEDLFNPPRCSAIFRRRTGSKSGLLGPEFQIYSTQTAADRADIMNTALYGTLDSTITLDLTPFVAAGRQCGQPARLHQLCFSAWRDVVEPAGSRRRPRPTRSRHPRPRRRRRSTSC